MEKDLIKRAGKIVDDCMRVKVDCHRDGIILKPDLYLEELLVTRKREFLI